MYRFLTVQSIKKSIYRFFGAFFKDGSQKRYKLLRGRRKRKTEVTVSEKEEIY